MRLAAIVAVSNNLVIGRNNALPWYLPEDLKYFKQVTLGKPVIMGRKTYDSIGRPLPGRCNIVITANPHWQAAGVKVVHSLAAAISLAEAECLITGAEEAMIMGGAQLYAEALPQVERLYLTQVEAEVEGDAFFPALDWQHWQLLQQQDHAPSGANPYPYSFRVYQRRAD
ncbi:dihydrofolate reductase [Balneatrix alpica]|uniref:dihydrofolate reductase n=1 Tax=Balneatrix alpica TaxID=75684 RepID=UPI00273A46B2|nr:dihydrofolate reductase [Balneatrix alpica]